MAKIDRRRLKAARERRGLSQEKAAAEIGVPQATWSRWETGASRPRGLNLRALLAWLDMERDQREGGDDVERSE